MRREDSFWWREGFTAEWWKTLLPEHREAFLDSLDPREQEDFLRDWRVWGRDKQIAPEGCWSEWLLLCGRGFGKLVDAETPIPTPTGWARLGDMAIGDWVIDEAGRPCRIVKTYDALPDVAYRLHFSDGTSIDACGDHQWVTWTHEERKAFLRSPHEDASRFPAEWPRWRLRQRKGGTDLPRAIVEAALDLRRVGISARKIAKRLGCCRIALGKHLKAGRFVERQATESQRGLGPQIRTTQQIVDTFTHGKRGDLNHSIPVAGPLQLPPQNLPLDPYVLGAWLGDGTAASGAITCHESDQPWMLEALQAFSPRQSRSDSQRIDTSGLSPILRDMGLRNNKHVPAIYLRGSIEQRLGLLQGLMDTDGHVTKGGHVEFCNTNHDLIRAVVELARSLGQKPVVYEGVAKLYGRVTGPKWRVCWTPTMPVFRMPRKAAKLALSSKPQSLRNHQRMIVRFERIDPKPMRCLTVDGPNSMFLCGEGMIPTHNTLTAVKTILSWIDEGWCRRIAIVGQGEGDIRSVMINGESGFITQSPSWNKPVFRPSTGALGELHWPCGAIGAVYSAEDAEALRGPEFHAGWFDEPMAVPAKKREEAYSNLEYGLRLGDNPRLIITTTPKPHKWIKEKVAECKRQEHKPLAEREFILTNGNTYENEENLAATFIRKIRRNEGTRRGRQEIHAEILNEDEGALWTMESLDRARMKGVPSDDRERGEFIMRLIQTMDRIVIGVDPNTTEGKTTHAAGIVVVGKRAGKHYVLADRSLVGVKPITWGKQVIRAAEEFGAHEIIAETNQGGDMIKGVCEQAAAELGLPMPKFYKAHTRKSKARRAEPVATAYERGEVFHVGHKGSEAAPGPFYLLEEQMETLHEGHDGTGEDFDRCDALCYAITRLGVKKAATPTSRRASGFMSFGEILNGSPV